MTESGEVGYKVIEGNEVELDRSSLEYDKYNVSLVHALSFRLLSSAFSQYRNIKLSLDILKKMQNMENMKNTFSARCRFHGRSRNLSNQKWFIFVFSLYGKYPQMCSLKVFLCCVLLLQGHLFKHFWKLSNYFKKCLCQKCYHAITLICQS